jgi:hypothetical protein
MRPLLLALSLVSIPAVAAAADAPSLFTAPLTPWQRVSFAAADTNAAVNRVADAGRRAAAAADVQTAAPPRVAFEYSDAYRTRARIHKIASYAMLPLVGTELLLGQSLYGTPSDAKRNAHIAVGTGIGVLFGLNTVTGAWNLWEARRDPSGRGRRLAHGLLMMAADAGFFATAATGPSREHFGTFEGSRSTHRAIAVTSIATATAGYLIMLFGGR